MEEAEELCDRVGIIVNGKLAAMGSAQYLKSKYGKGYRLSITTSPEREQNVRDFVREILPDAVLLNSLAGTQNFEIPRNNVRLSELFEIIERESKTLNILDWGISNTTLEEVFLHIVERSDNSDGTAASPRPYEEGRSSRHSSSSKEEIVESSGSSNNDEVKALSPNSQNELKKSFPQLKKSSDIL